MCSNFEFLNIRIKRKNAEEKVGSKVIKPILRHFGYTPPSSKDEAELEMYTR